MADAIFEHRRLASVYDDLDPDSSDLDPYVAIAAELGATTVLDVGCGTGTYALMLAAEGHVVTGVEPALASLEVARGKPGAEGVTWVHGTAEDLPPMTVDLATMTANVAQVFLTDEAWDRTLRALHRALRPSGHLVFEVRDPARKAWLEWETTDVTTIEGVGDVEATCTLLDVSGELVSFRWTVTFRADGEVVVSNSTLRFRSRSEVERSLEAAGFEVLDVRDAPDRPGREHVFIAQSRPDRVTRTGLSRSVVVEEGAGQTEQHDERHRDPEAGHDQDVHAFTIGAKAVNVMCRA